MTSHSPASSPELTKLPDIVFAGYKLDISPRMLEALQGYGRACYEAGSAAAAQAAWRPIAEAPKDMAAHIYLVNGRCVQGFVDATGVLCVQPDNMPWRKMKGKPTHWAPLLKLPAAPTGEQA